MTVGWETDLAGRVRAPSTPGESAAPCSIARRFGAVRANTLRPLLELLFRVAERRSCLSDDLLDLALHSGHSISHDLADHFPQFAFCFRDAASHLIPVHDTAP